jgi:UDP-N-acetylglucosamine--N-acetylmuramyl-(pentapeptide) pyrophosphoryl-undecaprenol N-acetylglucosamine transferase
VVLAGGGTAGHIEPALATADALRRLRPDVRVVLLGTERGLERRLVPPRGYELRLIPAVPLPRRPNPELLTLPGRLWRATRAAGGVLAEAGAAALVGFGGYVALPAYLAARRRRLPIVVHEANARPGLANRLGAALTPFVASASPAARLRHAVPIGMPLRRGIAALDRAALRPAARAGFGLRPELPTLLVFGGSQGAARLNRALSAAARRLADAGLQVLHLTGSAHLDTIRAAVGAARRPDDPPYVALDYLHEMELAYAAADLALCRAGAMTCAELTAVGLPAVYVPLPIGNGEQRLNAEPVVAAGGGLLVEDAQLDADWVEAQLPPLLTDRARLAGMAAAAAHFGRRDADEQLARLALRAAGLDPVATP